MLEKEVEGTVKNWAIKNGFLALKVRFAEAGYPDRLFLGPKGHTIFIEFKRPGEKAGLLQLHRVSQLRARRIPAFVCDSAVEAINILKAALDTSPIPGEGDQADANSGSSGVILRPGFGKDVDRSRRAGHTVQAEADPPGTDSGTAPGDVQDVAGRDSEVGGVPGAELRKDPWGDEGRGSDGPSYDPPDQSGGT